MSKEKKERKGRKVKKKYIVVGVLAVLVPGIFIFSKVTAGTAAMPVSCVAASKGDIKENVSASGKVAGAESKSYFSAVNAQIAKVNVRAGDVVKAGDALLTFDTFELELEKQKTDMEVTQAVSSYQSAVQESNENRNTYSEASLGLDELKQMKENQEQYVQGLKYQLEDNTADKRKDLYEWDKKLQEELSYQSRRLAEAAPGSNEKEEIEKVIDSLSGQRTDVQNELSLLSDEEELKQKQRLIDFEQKKLQDMTEEISRRESKQNASENGILNGYDKKAKEVSVESAKLNAQMAADNLAAADEGIIAEFDGVVTAVNAVEGATVTKGTQLFTVESLEKVKVTVELGKYDLEKVKENQQAEVTVAGSFYQGKVERIDRMAQPNAQNAAVVKAEIMVDNPDGSIFLGVEGKANIQTASAKDAVLIPYEAVNTDMDGDFCYLVKDGVIEKRRIITGISDDRNVEVKEGLSEGDMVVTVSNMNLEEGMAVVPITEQNAAGIN